MSHVSAQPLSLAPLRLDNTVGQWVATYPQTARLFESLQIDYCCGGKIALEQACWEKQLDPAQVVQQLQQAIDQDEEQSEQWAIASLTELCDHIERTHHAYLRTELPRLEQLIAKVVRAHGERHLELAVVDRVFAELRSELEPHMFKEERILFPAIRQLEQTVRSPSFPFGPMSNPIGMMIREHDHAGDALQQLRQLTSGYQPPPDACNTFRVMLDGLSDLESNMHQHVHKENNILFPRALALESSRLAGP